MSFSIFKRDSKGMDYFFEIKNFSLFFLKNNSCIWIIKNLQYFCKRF